VKEEYQKKVKPVTPQETLEEVLTYPIKGFADRGITTKTAQHFGVRTKLSSADGVTPIAIYFPYTEIQEDGSRKTVGFKKRDLTKNKKDRGYFTTIGNVSKESVDLFGTDCGNTTGGKKIMITEGEFDAMIVYQVLKDKYSKSNPTVVSIGFGTANAVGHLGQKHVQKFLRKFKETIVGFDNDCATPEERKKGIMKGQEATHAVYGLMPDIMVAHLPEGQDPCDMFKREGSEQLYWAFMSPKKFTPEGFIQFSDIREKAMELPTIGRPWPWPTMTKKTLGRREGEGYYIGAGVKMGKSTFLDQLCEFIITNEKDVDGNPQKVALFKFEEQPDETLKKLAGKFYRKDFSNPEKILFIDQEGNEVDIWGNPILDSSTFYTQGDLMQAVDDVGPNVILYNNYGRCHWDELKGAIRHAVLVEKVKDIFIDPITRLTAGMNASEANTELETFSDEISKMAKDLGFTFYCFCHLKAPEKGAPHEQGGKVFSSQFRGSRAMMQSCYYTCGIEGNKDPELPIKEQNTRYLSILDDRKHGRTCKFPVFYDEDTGSFLEPPEGFLESDCQTLAQFYNGGSNISQTEFEEHTEPFEPDF